MADVNANIGVGLDTSAALAGLRNLQREISAFQTSMAKGSAINAQAADNIRKNLIQNINATGQFNAQMKTISTSTESFTRALERNKLSMGEYFRYAGGASKTFGRLFRTEFDTINKVARERVKDLQTQYIKMGRDANGAMKAIAVRPLTLDMQNLGTQTQIAAQRQALFNQLLKQGSTNLLNFGKNTQWAGRQLMVGFTVPLAMLGTAAARTFMQMEEQAIRFKRVYGELFTTTEETEKALDNIKRLAEEFTKYGVAVEKTMELAADAAAMGQTGAALTAQVAEATRLAVLGGVEQQEALKTTISLTSAFGIAAEDLAKKTDFLNAVENQTVVSIEDLTIAIPKAGPVVKQLGGDVEDLAFFLTAMKEGGINASEGANALKSGLASLINPAQKTKDMLMGLGISIDSIVESNAGDIKNTVIGFANALDTLDPLNRARAIEQIFGKFQFSRISTLFQNVVKEGTQAERVLKLTRASSEELAILSERELKRVEDSPMYKFKQAIEDIKVELVPLGKAFLEAVTPIVKFGRDVLEQFNGLEEGTKKFLVALTGIGGIIAPVFLMGFGLVANGVANLIKMFTVIKTVFNKAGSSSTMLGQNVSYMTSEQLEAAAVAASLEQVHSKLTQTFTSEATAVNNLRRAYQQATAAQAPFMMGMPGRGATAAPKAPRVGKYNSGVLSVPGPKGAGDIVPALLSPGEAVIPAKEAERNRTLIQALISGKIPKFFGGTANVARVFLGMPKSSKRVGKEREAADQVDALFKQSKFANQPAEQYGHQIAATRGHSFPIFGVGGIYAKPDGSRVFVKPVMDERAALAEMRGTQIARDVHGLISPQQRIVVMKDPTDLQGKRKFLALESPLDPRLATPTGEFTKKEYIKQLVASTLRGDKDLSADNLYGRVLADVGPAGVFTRASGLREYAKKGEINSMAQQALINLLGVKGGAKKAFAETTAPLARQMKPDEFDALMRAEIRESLPKLRKTVDSFNLKGEELRVYKDMIQRLEDGLRVNWRDLHAVHTQVGMAPPKKARVQKFNSGVISVPGPKGKGDIVPAMLSPGEAVIPADVAQKNRGFISAMIDGSIPGFEDGVIIPEKYQSSIGNPNKGYASIPRSAEKLVAQGFGAQAQQILNLIDRQNLTMAQAEQVMRNMNTAAKLGPTALSNWTTTFGNVVREGKTGAEILREVKSRTGYGTVSRSQPQFAHIGGGAFITTADGTQLKVTSMLGMQGISGEINRQLARGGADTRAFLQNYNSLGPAKWHESIIAAGGDPSKIGGSVGALDKEIDRIIARSGATKIFDLDSAAKAHGKGAISMERVYAQARANLLVRHPALFGALDGAHAIPRDARYGGSKAGAVRKADRAAAALALGAQATAEQNLVKPKSGRVTPATGSRVPPKTNVVGGGPTDTRMVAASPNETIMTSKSTSAIRRGFAARIPGLGLVGRVDGQPSGQGTERVRVTQAGQFRDRATNRRISRAEAQRLMRLDRQNERRRFQAEKARDLKAKRSAGITQAYGMSAKEFDKLSKDQQTKLRAQRKQTELEEKRMRIANTQARLADEQRIADEKRKLAEKEEKRAARKEKMRGMGGKVAAGAGGAAMLGVMGASMMGGEIGEVAQQLMFPAMMLPMILPMLTNPIGAAVVAIGALTAGFILLDQQTKKNIKAAYDLEMATGAGADSLEVFSQYSGNVTAGEILDLRRQSGPDPFAIQEGKTEFGRSFLASEGGSAMQASFGEALNELGRSGAISGLVSQLATGVISGALDPSQARSIAAALGEALGDYGVGIEVNSRLNSLLGPNGENLLTDPLKVRIELLKESQAGIEKFSDVFSNEVNTKFAMGLNRPQFITGVTAVGGILGAAAGAAAGAKLGATFGALAGPKGVIAGAIVGGLVGGVGAFFTSQAASAEAFAASEAASGAFVANSAIALQQQQELLDSLQLDYEQRIANAKAEGDLAKATDLQNQYIEERNALLLQGRQTTDQMLASFNAADTTSQNTIMTTFDEQIKSMYADDPLTSGILPQVLNQINALEDKDTQVVLKANLLSGDILPATMQNLLNGEDSEKRIDLIVNLGAATAAQALQMSQMFGEKDANRFLDNVGAKDPGAAQAYMDSFAAVRQVFSEVPGDGLQIALGFYLENEDKLTQYTGQIENLKQIADEKNGLTIQVVQEMLGDDVFKLSKEASDYFNSLNKDNQVRYVMSYLMTFDVKSSGNFSGAAINHAMGQGQAAYKSKFGGTFQQDAARNVDMAEARAMRLYQEYIPWLFTSANQPGPSTTNTTTTSGGSGSKPVNPFEGILRKLKELRRSTIELKETAQGTLDVINNLFDGGNKSFTGFTGMSQQIRGAGGNQQLIDMVLGMSDEEWKKWKDKLFKFDNKGNIVALKRDAANIQASLNAITLGDFQDSQKATIAGVNDQFRAINKLIGQGFSLKDAYSIVEDQALATAIAQSKITSADFQTLKKDIENANAALRRFEANARVVADIVAFDEQSQFEKLLKDGGYSEVQIQALMSDDGLREMVLAGQTSAQAFADRLKQIMGSKDFLEATFNSGMSAVDNAFAVLEEGLRLDFMEANKADFDTITKAERDIALLNDQVDDYEAALTRMQEDEDKINEIYDERIEALDKIEEANTKIAERQRAQISVAEALSRGDVAAAASAIQELRAQQIRSSIEDRRKVLEAAREKELNALTQTANGQKLTRSQIEEKIRGIQREILEIEEKSLEPAERRIRLAQDILDDEISSLEVLGKTRTEWDNIKNEVDQARINTTSYVGQITAAIVAIEQLKALYASEWADITAPTVPTPDKPIVVTPEPTTPDPTPTGNTGGTPGGNQGSPSSGRRVNPAYTSWINKYNPLKTRIDSLNNQLREYQATQRRNTDTLAAYRRTKAAAGQWGYLYDDEIAEWQRRVAQMADTLRWQGRAIQDVERQITALGPKPAQYLALGGMVKGYNLGGMVARGTDTVPAMLTPGEFVMSKYAVQNYGADKMKAINSGTYNGDSVYNYSVNVSVKSDANPDQIASAVMSRIKQIDSQRIRSGKL